MAGEREITLRIGLLSRILQLGEYIEGNEKVVDLKFDSQVNQVTLYLEEKEVNDGNAKH